MKILKAFYVILPFVLIFACCSGVFSCACYIDNRERDKTVQRLSVPIEENNGQFRVLYSYPVRNNKGQLVGHSLVVEGLINGKRIEVTPQPELPVPGEVWIVAVFTNGYNPSYKFIEKVK